MIPKDDLSKKTGTRSARQVKGLPNLDNIQRNFDRNIEEIKNLSSIADSIGEEQKRNDVLRAQVVFLCSVLDTYMHEIFAYGLLMMFYDYWHSTPAYKRQNVPLTDLGNVCDKGGGRDNGPIVTIVRNAITTSIKHDTLTRPEAINDVLNSLGLDSRYKDVVEQYAGTVNAAIDLRNLVVHQTGREAPSSLKKAEIQKSKVEDYIKTFVNLQKDIQSLLSRHDSSEKESE